MQNVVCINILWYHSNHSSLVTNDDNKLSYIISNQWHV